MANYSWTPSWDRKEALKYRCESTNQIYRKVPIEYVGRSVQFQGYVTNTNEYWVCSNHQNGNSSCASCKHYYKNLSRNIPPQGYLLNSGGATIETPTRQTVFQRKVGIIQDNILNLFGTYTDSNLFKAFKDIPNISKSFAEYNVQHTTIMGYDKTIFWYFDECDNVRYGKVMQYDKNGHRTNYVCSIESYLAQNSNTKLNSNYEYKPILFGTHLLKKYPTHKVVLVESEKTALLGNAYCLTTNQHCIFLASGGKNINEDNLKVLHDRDVFMFADVDAFSEWKAFSEKHNFKCGNWQKSYCEKYGIVLGEKADFGDFVVEYFKKQTPIGKLKNELVCVPTSESNHFDINKVQKEVREEYFKQLHKANQHREYDDLAF